MQVALNYLMCNDAIVIPGAKNTVQVRALAPTSAVSSSQSSAMIRRGPRPSSFVVVFPLQLSLTQT